MAKVSRSELKNGEILFSFFCEGCGCCHMFTSSWKFNQDFKNPTVSPSILVKHGRDGRDEICHSFITDGKIRYLNDCTHKLAGKIVELQDFWED